jgi:hypothetical protein
MTCELAESQYCEGNTDVVVSPGVARCLWRGSSRVMGNYHARFLGGWARATAPGYPTSAIKTVIRNKRKWLLRLSQNGNGGWEQRFPIALS